MFLGNCEDVFEHKIFFARESSISDKFCAMIHIFENNVRVSSKLNHRFSIFVSPLRHISGAKKF